MSLRGVARLVGVSAPAIYAHFADIDAILLAVAERCFADLANYLTAATDSIAPSDCLRAICAAYLDYAEAYPGRYQVMFGGVWNATAAIDRGKIDPEAVSDLGQNVLVMFTDAINTRARTTPANESAFSAAMLTWVTLHGYAHQRLVAQAFPWPPGITDRLLDRISNPKC